MPPAPPGMTPPGKPPSLTPPPAAAAAPPAGTPTAASSAAASSSDLREYTKMVSTRPSKTRKTPKVIMSRRLNKNPARLRYLSSSSSSLDRFVPTKVGSSGLDDPVLPSGPARAAGGTFARGTGFMSAPGKEESDPSATPLLPPPTPPLGFTPLLWLFSPL